MADLPVVYFYGDSNTYGYDPRDLFGARYPASVRWTDLLQHRAEGLFRFVPDGVNGRVVPVIKEHSFVLETLCRKLDALQPLALLCVMLGTNDLLNMPAADADVVSDRMYRFVGYLQQLPECHETQLLLVAPPHMQAQDPYYRSAASASLRIAAGYERVAAEHQIHFTDPALWNPELAYDGVHLSEEGHRVFADQMFRTVQELLRSIG